MAHRYHVLDVFTSEAFTGNPLAVVLDADELTSDQMQRIAREFNLSETVFVCAATRPGHSAKIRIFTPRSELPFAGHPTIGTAILLATLRSGDVNGENDALVVLEEEVGPVRVGVRKKAGEAAFAEFDIPVLPQSRPLDVPKDLLAAALGLSPTEIGFENHVPSVYFAGLNYTYVPVRGLDVLARAWPCEPHYEKIFGALGEAYVYCRETAHTTSDFHARMFAPGAGIPEDPATGSAAAGFAGVVHKFDQPRDGTHRHVIEQGYEMDRPSQIDLELIVTGGQLRTVRIGGCAVPVMSGELSV